MSTTTTLSRQVLVEKARQFPMRSVMLLGAVLAVAGAVIFVWVLAGGRAARAWQGWHVNFMFWTGLAQALVVLAASQKLAKGHWAGLMIRFAEAAVAFLFVALVLFAGEFVGRAYLFAWIRGPQRAEVGPWFTTTFFFVRTWAILVVMAWLSWRFVRRDMAPDLQELKTGRPVNPDANEKGLISREAAILTVAFAFGYSLLGFDLIMSLNGRWVSNLYGAFYFMGSFLAALAGLAVLTLAVRRAMGLVDLVSPKQLHDLGKLVFGFTVFWGYLLWAQFLVIWYGNIPEETYFIFYRLWGPWRPVGAAVFILVFVVPFIGLLGVRPKKYPPTFALFALISLAGIWLERYLEIVPSVNGGAGPAIGLPELGATLLFAGFFLLSLGWFGARYPMVSPRLAADTVEREQH
ncbi:MAG: hypothetical protein DMD33_03965 [Gemmatimonadetes bacterium]|nr:MAG: hypothetical protein DMD33_03965 [Gemmatimonadota bacterium]PYO77359.1 MAG: hypothetical protein DMD67_06735 [Gemmatimonadota bacterium]TLY54338.1 MAG: hypothetical protein E6K55_05965 [Gemmatimonadota bacterium]